MTSDPLDDPKRAAMFNEMGDLLDKYGFTHIDMNAYWCTEDNNHRWPGCPSAVFRIEFMTNEEYAGIGRPSNEPIENH